MKGTDIHIGDIVVISKASSRSSNRTFQAYGQKARVIETQLHEPYSYSKRTSATKVVLLDKDGNEMMKSVYESGAPTSTTERAERIVPNRDLISVEDFEIYQNKVNKRADERDHRNTLRLSEAERVEAILRAAGIPDDTYRIYTAIMANGAPEVTSINFHEQKGALALLDILK